MKRSIAMKWAAALESGEYKQGTGMLRSPVTNRFCCLGVLCNIHAQEHPEIAQKEDNPEVYLGYDTELPDEVTDWAGMAHREGIFRNNFKLEEYPYAYSLIDLNDSEEFSFPEIAKVIRKHWKEL